MADPARTSAPSTGVGQSHSAHILSQAFGGLVGRVATLLFATLNIFLLAVILAPRDYGIYLLFIRTISLIGLIGDLGLGQSAAAHFSLYAAFDRHLHGRFVRIIAASSILTCLGAAILLFGVRELLVPSLPPTLLWLLLATTPALIYANAWSGMMMGAGLIWPLNIVRSVTGALFLAGTLIFVLLLDGGLTAALLVYCGTTLVQVAAMLVLTRFYAAECDVPQPTARTIVHFGLRSHVNAVFYLIWTNLPLFLLTAQYSPAAAGLFGLATQILDKLMLPAHALHEAVYQRMRRVAPEAAAGKAMAYVAASFMIAAATALLVAPILYWGLPPLLGEGYAQVGALGLLLLLGLPFMSGLLLFDPYFVNALQRPGLASWLGALQVAITAAMSAPFIAAFGAAGAAASLVLAQAAGFAVALFALKRMSGLPWNALTGAAAGAVRHARSWTAALAGRGEAQA